jgi:S1-C subfamily serine protease
MTQEQSFHPAGWQALPPPTLPAGPRPHFRRRLLAAITLALVALVAAAATVAVHASQGSSSVDTPSLQTVAQPAAVTTGAGLDAQTVAAKVSPGLVDVNTVVATLGQGGEAAGTGMVLTSAGLVLTNNHVVQGSTSIRVTIPSSGRTYSASVVGVDPTDDVALIQVQGVSNLKTVTLADSSTLSVGEQVVALGNAFGQGGSPQVTQGSITALDQSITASDGGSSERLNGLIETDAPISPGDSGGALANAAGQVVGMITAGESNGPDQTADAGYAITSSRALGVVNQILSGQSGGDILIGPTPYLGVAVTDTPSGPTVLGVAQGSPAASIGLARGDVITSIGGVSIQSASDVGPALWSHKPGDRVEVTWVDATGSKAASATLVAGPVA